MLGTPAIFRFRAPIVVCPSHRKWYKNNYAIFPNKKPRSFERLRARTSPKFFSYFEVYKNIDFSSKKFGLLTLRQRVIARMSISFRREQRFLFHAMKKLKNADFSSKKV